ncbi:hypothetical protein NPIL_197051 [Nephila pilipes]|uniref:Uncharacterized protein n=1 Tax=Nephila pilipes TaxID=299642 RepID=A0A8X6PJM7_NEPPI|nr:hypothetical protein NPIL_197051 [Nephila pilipes]
MCSELRGRPKLHGAAHDPHRNSSSKIFVSKECDSSELLRGSSSARRRISRVDTLDHPSLPRDGSLSSNLSAYLVEAGMFLTVPGWALEDIKFCHFR